LERPEGCYVILDCDINVSDNQGEVTLFKNNPVLVDKNIHVEYDRKNLITKRIGGSLFIKVALIKVENLTLPKYGSIPELLNTNHVDAILRIT